MPQQHLTQLDLPAAPAPTASCSAVTAPCADKPGILVVDDDYLVLGMVHLGLERKGFEVWQASSGRAALELYRDHQEEIGVVLLDVRMPDMDGPETLDALRTLNADVVVCLMSGYPGDYDPATLIQRGAAYVLAKPFRLDDLARLLHQLAPKISANGVTQ